MDQFDHCEKCGNIHDGNCSTEAIYFYWYPQPHQNPTQVFIIGDWSKWQCKQPMKRTQLKNGLVYYSVLLALSPGVHQFKYLIDGWWQNDKTIPTIQNGLGCLNNVIQILPKKTYVLRQGNSVRISSKICSDNLKIIGSWDEWSTQKPMIKIFNPLRGCDENIVNLELNADKTYEFKFKLNNQYMIDEKYPTIMNSFGSLNNYIIVYDNYISIQTTPNLNCRKITCLNIESHSKPLKGKAFKFKKIVGSVDLPYQRVEGHSMCKVGEYIYMFGGKSRNQFYNSLLKINCKFDKVCSEQVYPDGRAFHFMEVYGNKILIYGGHNNSVLQDYNAYDVSNFKWQTTRNIPKNNKKKLQKQSCVIYEHLLVFFGGYEYQEGSQVGIISNDITVLDLQRMQWVDNILIQSEHPVGRFAHTASIYESTMYIFGGIHSFVKNQMLNLNDLWKINLKNINSLIWQKLQPKGKPPIARHGHTMNTLANLLVVFGGNQDNNLFLNDLMVYHILQNQWITPFVSGTIPRPRSNHASTNITGNRIVIYGGKTSDNIKNSAFYILQPVDLVKSTSFFNDQDVSDQ